MKGTPKSNRKFYMNDNAGNVVETSPTSAMDLLLVQREKDNVDPKTRTFSPRSLVQKLSSSSLFRRTPSSPRSLEMLSSLRAQSSPSCTEPNRKTSTSSSVSSSSSSSHITITAASELPSISLAEDDSELLKGNICELSCSRTPKRSSSLRSLKKTSSSSKPIKRTSSLRSLNGMSSAKRENKKSSSRSLNGTSSPRDQIKKNSSSRSSKAFPPAMLESDISGKLKKSLSLRNVDKFLSSGEGLKSSSSRCLKLSGSGTRKKSSSLRSLDAFSVSSEDPRISSSYRLDLPTSAKPENCDSSTLEKFLSYHSVDTNSSTCKGRKNSSSRSRRLSSSSVPENCGPGKLKKSSSLRSLNSNSSSHKGQKSSSSRSRKLSSSLVLENHISFTLKKSSSLRSVDTKSKGRKSSCSRFLKLSSSLVPESSGSGSLKKSSSLRSLSSNSSSRKGRTSSSLKTLNLSMSSMPEIYGSALVPEEAMVCLPHGMESFAKKNERKGSVTYTSCSPKVVETVYEASFGDLDDFLVSNIEKSPRQRNHKKRMRTMNSRGASNLSTSLLNSTILPVVPADSWLECSEDSSDENTSAGIFKKSSSLRSLHTSSSLCEGLKKSSSFRSLKTSDFSKHESDCSPLVNQEAIVSSAGMGKAPRRCTIPGKFFLYDDTIAQLKKEGSEEFTHLSSKDVTTWPEGLLGCLDDPSNIPLEDYELSRERHRKSAPRTMKKRCAINLTTSLFTSSIFSIVPPISESEFCEDSFAENITTDTWAVIENRQKPEKNVSLVAFSGVSWGAEHLWGIREKNTEIEGTVVACSQCPPGHEDCTERTADLTEFSTNAGENSWSGLLCGGGEEYVTEAQAYLTDSNTLASDSVVGTFGGASEQACGLFCPKTTVKEIGSLVAKCKEDVTELASFAGGDVSSVVDFDGTASKRTDKLGSFVIPALEDLRLWHETFTDIYEDRRNHAFFFGPFAERCYPLAKRENGMILNCYLKGRLE